MIGKIARAMVGRSVARKHGYSAGIGAVAGLLAPMVLKAGASLVKKAGSSAKDARRRRKGPEYLSKPLSK